RRGVDRRPVADELAGALSPDADELTGLIARLEQEMLTAAGGLQFEEAALLRDEIAELRSMLTRDPVDGSPVLPGDSADITAEAEV
ncbi:MAG: UvrB/UvrC motif-containing protein, partial [Acidimicrobiales bacterium]